MKQPSEITAISPEAQKKWDDWLEASIVRMVKDPNSALFRALVIATQALQDSMEPQIGDYVATEIDKLRSEIGGRQIVASLTGDRL